MNRPDLDAIEYADHMLMGNIERYGVDKWYPQKITELIAYARELEQELENSRSGHDVTITIAQNAAARIRELEAALKPFAKASRVNPPSLSAWDYASRVMS